MAVVVDGICVIVRNRTLAQIFPGGLEAYAREAARAVSRPVPHSNHAT